MTPEEKEAAEKQWGLKKGDKVTRDGQRMRVSWVCEDGVVFDPPTSIRFGLSIRKASKCLFSRRNGHEGALLLGYSFRLRLFNRDIL
jgi:hypothetical protein